MEWLWTWGGKSFGYRLNDALYTRKGYFVGGFIGDEVYWGDGGKYLGELMRGRLITRHSKKNHTRGVPRRGKTAAYTPYVNHVGWVMISGCEDFPHPEAFEI